MPFVSYKLFLFLLTNRTGCRSNLWQIERRVAKAESYWAKRESNTCYCWIIFMFCQTWFPSLPSQVLRNQLLSLALGGFNGQN